MSTTPSTPSLHHRCAALLLATTLLLPLPAHAQWLVYDTANHWENIQQVLQAAYAVLQRIEQIQRLIDQLEWMEQQLEGLEDPHSREVASLLYTLSRVIQRGEALVYSLERLEQRYEELFRAFDPSDEPTAEWEEQTRVLLDTTEAVLVSTKRLANNFVPSQQVLGRMKAQLDSAETNAELIQASGLITAWSGEETSKLLQQVAALTNLLAVDIAHRTNAKAMGEATLERWIHEAYLPTRYDASDAPPLIPRDYPGAPR
jgi:P-type conjugative transfer protein TrbJ